MIVEMTVTATAVESVRSVGTGILDLENKVFEGRQNILLFFETCDKPDMRRQTDSVLTQSHTIQFQYLPIVSVLYALNQLFLLFQRGFLRLPYTNEGVG